ncbi:MAG: hypothetical protein Ct9H90mP18_03690 [Gammaproteobacteria bacterium]|nr:MAG: hypothetical protein Ct9H90mP18_03690 [Gammaproteobacteria bacterium]
MLPGDFYIGIYTYCGFESKEIEFSDVPLLLISGKQEKLHPLVIVEILQRMSKKIQNIMS